MLNRHAHAKRWSRIPAPSGNRETQEIAATNATGGLHSIKEWNEGAHKIGKPLGRKALGAVTMTSCGLITAVIGCRYFGTAAVGRRRSRTGDGKAATAIRQ